MNIKKLSMERWRPVLLLALLLGCGGGGSFWVTVEFPAGYQDQATSLEVYAIAPTGGASCGALKEGAALPGDPDYRVEDSVSMDLPVRAGARQLKGIETGRRFFYARAKNAQDYFILAGCTEAQAGGSGVQDVLVKLDWICRVSNGGIESCDGVDNDCDGETDEDCLQCQTDQDCNDGDSCNDPDVCNNGVCEHQQTDCSHLDSDCAAGTCNPQTGQCEAQPINEGTACNDGQYCNTGETCQAGVCTGGGPTDCGSAGDDCNQGICNEADDRCDTEPVVSGTPCDGGDADFCNSSCDQSGNCINTPVNCDDGDICNGTETCNPADGTCQSPGNLPASTYCEGSQLVTCDGNGAQTSTESCPLGCNSGADPNHCYQLDPSNVDPDLLCANPSDLVVPGDITIDTYNGTISGNYQGSIVFNTVSQGGPAPDIGVFSFSTIDIQSGATVTVVGDNALALLGCTDVIIAGEIEANASGQSGGPGGFDGGTGDNNGGGACPGEAAGSGTTQCPEYCAAGGGGGGHGGSGGSGGPVDCFMGGNRIQLNPGAGGTGNCGEADLSPMAGGSGGAGGTHVPGAGDSAPGAGGGGGGAVQVAAGASLTVAGSGGISAAGGGGGGSVSGGGAGGGAGGAILLEAVSVEIQSGAYLTANGGGGGGGDCG